MKRLLTIVPIAALAFAGFVPAQAGDGVSVGDPPQVQVEGKAIDSWQFGDRCDADATPMGEVLTAGTTQGEPLDYDIFRFTVEPGSTKQLTVTGVYDPRVGLVGYVGHHVTTLVEQPDGALECEEIWWENTRRDGLLEGESPELGPGDYWYKVGNSFDGHTEYVAVTETTET